MPVPVQRIPDELRDKDTLSFSANIERKLWLAGKNLALRVSPRPSEKQCVLIPGMQRSGSKLLVQIFEWSRHTDCYPENDRRAFDYYQMRNPDYIRYHLIRHSPAPFFVIKALCESDHVDLLLDTFTPAKAIWILRDFRDCVNSCIRNFGGFAARACAIAEDRHSAGWRGRGMSDATWELLRRHARPDMNEATGAALQWYYRNILFFEQGFERDERVMHAHYEDLVSRPIETTSEIFDFVGIPDMSPWIVRKIHARSVKKNAEPPIDPEIRQLCMDLQERFAALPARPPRRV